MVQIIVLFLFLEAANSTAQGEMSALAQRLETITRQFEEEKKQATLLKKQLDVAQRAEQEKNKLQKEVIILIFSIRLNILYFNYLVFFFSVCFVGCWKK